MKRIYPIFLLLFAITTFAQNKSELKSKSRVLLDRAAKAYKTSSGTPADVFAAQRFTALEEINLIFTDKEKDDIILFFKSQYEPLRSAVIKYEENNKSDGSKIELIKLIIKNEEDFRNRLSGENSKIYLRYTNEFHWNTDFILHFFADVNLERWKANLK